MLTASGEGRLYNLIAKSVQTLLNNFEMQVEYTVFHQCYIYITFNKKTCVVLDFLAGNQGRRTFLVKSNVYLTLMDLISGVRNKNNRKRDIHNDCFEAHKVYNVVSVLGEEGLQSVINQIVQ